MRQSSAFPRYHLEQQAQDARVVHWMRGSSSVDLQHLGPGRCQAGEPHLKLHQPLDTSGMELVAVCGWPAAVGLSGRRRHPGHRPIAEVPRPEGALRALLVTCDTC